MTDLRKAIVSISWALALALISAGCSDRSVPTAQATVRGGVVEVPENTYDFGTVVRGSVVKHVFVVKNTGDQPVNILSVKAGCSCTAALVSNPSLEPGAGADVEVSFDTRGRKGFQSKSVKIVTDSSLSPTLTVTLSGRIEPAVAFEPGNLELGQVARGTEVVREVAIAGLEADGVKIESIEISPPDDKRLSAEIVNRADESSKGAKVRVMFKSSGDYGVFRARVSVVTSSTVEPSIGFGVYAEVTGDIVADTSVVTFPPRGDVSMADQSTQTAVVKLKSLSKKSFRFKGIKDQSGLLKVVSTDQVDGGWQITLAGPLASEPVEGEFLILTDGKDAEPLKMRFVAGRRHPGRVQSGRFGSDVSLRSDARATPGGKGARIMREFRDSASRQAWRGARSANTPGTAKPSENPTRQK